MDAKDVKIGMWVEQVHGRDFTNGGAIAQVTEISSDTSEVVRLSTGCKILVRNIQPAKSCKVTEVINPGLDPENYIKPLSLVTPTKDIPRNSIDHAWDTGPLPAPANTANSDGGRTGYYDVPQGADTLNDLILHKDMNFQIGNIFKACYRYGGKTGTNHEYDLRKIIFFAKAELKRIGAIEN